MKKGTFVFGLLALMVLFTSCAAVGDIFKAGIWSGIILVVIIVAVIIFVISKFSGKK